MPQTPQGLPVGPGSASSGCPLGDEEQNPCPRGRAESLQSPGGSPRPQGQFLSTRWPESVRVQMDSGPQTLGPIKALDSVAQRSQKATFRTWKDTYLNSSCYESCSCTRRWPSLCCMSPGTGGLPPYQTAPPGGTAQTGRSSPWGGSLLLEPHKAALSDRAGPGQVPAALPSILAIPHQAHLGP